MRRVIGLLMVGLVAGVLLPVATAVAAMDFEGQTPGNFSTAAHIDVSGDYDPEPVDTGAQGWFVTEGLPDCAQVTNYSYADPTVGPAGGAGGSSLYLRCDRHDGKVALARFRMGSHIGQEAAPFGVAADIYVPSASPGGTQIGLGDVNNLNVQALVYSGDFGSGLGWNYHDGAAWQLAAALPMDAWTPVGIQITQFASSTGTMNGTFDLYVGGAKVATGIPHGVYRTRYAYVASDSDGYFDNVDFGPGVPEPATLVLLAVGASLTALRRRR